MSTLSETFLGSCEFSWATEIKVIAPVGPQFLMALTIPATGRRWHVSTWCPALAMAFAIAAAPLPEVSPFEPSRPTRESSLSNRWAKELGLSC